MHRRLPAAVALASAAVLALPSLPAAASEPADPAPLGFGAPVALAGGAADVETGDVTGDGRADVVRLVVANGSWHVAADGLPASETTPGTPGDLALGDLDGDGDLDALVALSDGHALLRNASGWTVTTHAGPGAPRLRLADADGDGDLDAYRLGSGTLTIAANDGTGAFGTAVPVATVEGADRLATGTVDGVTVAALGGDDGLALVRADGTTTAYDSSGDPLLADVTGDGVTDLVAGTATAVVAYAGPDLTTRTTLLPFGASDLHVSGGYLAGVTPHGAFAARRSGGAWTALHAGLAGASRAAFADVAGDALPDVVASDGAALARRWTGSATTTHVFALSGPKALNATQVATYVADVRNAAVPPALTWAADRGAFEGPVYTASPTANPDGTRAGLYATYAGLYAGIAVTIYNEQYEPYALAGREIRAIAETPNATLYLATDDGVLVERYQPRRYEQVGTTALTGTDARSLVLADDRTLLGLFAEGLFRYDPADADPEWVPVGPGGVTDLDTLPEVSTAVAVADGAVFRSPDAGLTWVSTGLSGVAEAEATGWHPTVWARTAAGALVTGEPDEDGAYAWTVVPSPFAEPVVDLIDSYGPIVEVEGRGLHHVYGDWVPADLPPGVDSTSYHAHGGVTAFAAGTRDVYRQRGAHWHPTARGLAPGVTVLSMARVVGYKLDMLGTSDGLYRMVVPYAPATPAIAEHPGDLSGPSATFAFGEASPWWQPNATPTVGYVCALDGVWAPCTSPVTYTGLASGGHTLSVAAVDAHGHESAEHGQHHWTVDADPPPAPVLTAKPQALAAETSGSFAFTTGDVPTCTIDGDPVVCDSGTWTYVLPAGEHTFTVVATDAAGNVSTPATHTWTIDLTPPAAPVLTSAPQARTVSRDAAFAWTPDPDVARYACLLDGTEKPCGQGTFAATVEPGSHAFELLAYDALDRETRTRHEWVVDATAPGITIATPPASLTPGIQVSFDEEPATSSVRLLTGTTVVPSRLTWLDDHRVVVAPVSPLVPGQLYTVSVVVADDLGNAGGPATRTFRAPGSQQETSVAARPSWRRVPWRGAHGGWFTTSHSRGASATFAFSGTAVTWHTVRGPAYGLADVYVDGVLKASKVNLYATTLGATSRTFSGLPAGAHTIRVVARGERGSRYGTGSEVAVDAFRVGATLHVSPVLAQAWARVGAAGASGGAYAGEDAGGATFSMTFRGRGVDWLTVLGPGMGKARVTIDGVVKGTFDQRAATARYGVRRSFTGLADGVHTITVTVLGDGRVAVDRIDARP